MGKLHNTQVQRTGGDGNSPFITDKNDSWIASTWKICALLFLHWETGHKCPLSWGLLSCCPSIAPGCTCTAFPLFLFGPTTQPFSQSFSCAHMSKPSSHPQWRDLQVGDGCLPCCLAMPCFSMQPSHTPCPLLGALGAMGEPTCGAMMAVIGCFWKFSGICGIWWKVLTLVLCAAFGISPSQCSQHVFVCMFFSKTEIFSLPSIFSCHVHVIMSYLFTKIQNLQGWQQWKKQQNHQDCIFAQSTWIKMGTVGRGAAVLNLCRSGQLEVWLWACAPNGSFQQVYLHIPSEHTSSSRSILKWFVFPNRKEIILFLQEKERREWERIGSTTASHGTWTLRAVGSQISARGWQQQRTFTAAGKGLLHEVTKSYFWHSYLNKTFGNSINSSTSSLFMGKMWEKFRQRMNGI